MGVGRCWEFLFCFSIPLLKIPIALRYFCIMVIKLFSEHKLLVQYSCLVMNSVCFVPQCLDLF